MLSCKELIKLINEQENATFFQRAEMRLHLMMCKHCSVYNKHLKYMKLGFKNLFSKMTSVDKKKIEQLEEKIIKGVNK